jgi:hypothetical protein
MTIKVSTRKRMKSSSFGLPKKKKFPLTNKRQAVSAIAYAVKGARAGTITPQERDIVLRKAKQKFPSISITPIRKSRGNWRIKRCKVCGRNLEQTMYGYDEFAKKGYCGSSCYNYKHKK